jgi:predicted deacylase
VHVSHGRDLVELAKPDLAGYRAGNTGVPYVWSFEAAAPGPHVLVNALMHGNEISGAIALARLLDAGVRPLQGRLTFSFANVEAFDRFDIGDPRSARFVEEDMNRVWSSERLQGGEDSLELRRARELQPVFETADRLLDLHSMQTPSPPLMLSTLREKGRRLAARIGMPAWVIADRGHANGTRLIDFGAFGEPEASPVAVLLEAGQHWRAESAVVALETTVRFLETTGAIGAATAAALAPEARPRPQHFVEVTEAVMVRTPDFAFARDFVGLEIVPEEGALIATDGELEIRAPYPDCVLVMPSRRLTPGLTGVRLGRLTQAPV